MTPTSPEGKGEPQPAAGHGGLWQRLHHHKVLQWALGYLGAALAIAHGQELIGHAFHWPELVGQMLIGALIVGFPVVLVLAWYHGHRGLRSFSPAEMTIIALLMLIGAGLLILFVRPAADHAAPERVAAASTPALDRTAAGTAAASQGGKSLAQVILEIDKLVRKDQYGVAFKLAFPLAGNAQARDDPHFQELWHQIDLPIRPLVAESGATVYFKPYDDADGPWLKAGVTPLAGAADAPRGVLRLKVEKPGFRTGYFAIANPGPSVENDPAAPSIAGISWAKVPLPLAADGALADDMVLVPHTNTPVYVSGWSESIAGSDQYDIPAFAIGRSEVTNQQYKEFVDAGGYDNPTYWQGLKFEDQGRALTWAEARARFVDETRRPGPAGWQLSTYPAGQADMPVGGISWYEAVAYARFRGQALPTIHHWARAAFAPNEAWFNTAPVIALASRFSADAPVPARTDAGLGPWGTINMAGNVREWVWNFGGSRGIAMGGGWSDYASFYQSIYYTSPMERLPEDGVRLMQPLPGGAIDEQLLRPIKLGIDTANYQRAPVSDDEFRAMRFQFTASHARPVQTSVQQVRETGLWVAEEVILRFADQETTTAYVVRPKSHPNPLQVVIYGPPGDSILARRPNRNALEQVRPPADTIVASGRALVIPIWDGSYETALPQPRDVNEMLDRGRRSSLSWYRQLSTTLDYLETRPDLDMRRVGFMGFSFGAAFVGPIMLATEGRLKTGVLISGGVVPAPGIHPMLDAVNYAPRIKVPVLMAGGRYDHLFLYEQSQKRLFSLLGTPPQQKQLKVYDVGHFAFPSNSIAMDISDWFDKYLGPVR